MSGRSICCGCLFAVLTFPALADESPARPVVAKPAAGASTPRAAIERTLTIIDLVVEHHINAPTQQEMVLQGALALYRLGEKAPPYGLAGQVSDLRDRQAAADLLEAAWTAASAKEARFAFVRVRLLEGAFAAAPGNVSLIENKEFRVLQQFQANRYVGIGIALGHDKETSFPQIANLLDGPAKRAGAWQGDLIESIDGDSMKGVETMPVVDRLRGPEGTRLTVVVRQKEAKDSRTLEITRGVVPMRTVFGWKRQANPQQFQVTQGIACVRLTDIGGSVVHELRQVEEQLQSEKDLRALIIDLRDCEGSRPFHPAALLADALLTEGAIGRVRRADRTQELTADPDCLFRGLPLAVLVDQTTCNTGEWLAACLQDNRRAIIVGAPTAGNAYVNQGIPLPGEDETLLLPDGILERPSGKSLLRPKLSDFERRRPVAVDMPKQPWGVTPDHLVLAQARVAAFAGNPLAAEEESPPDATPFAPPLVVPDDPVLSRACEVLSGRLKGQTARVVK